MDGPGSALPVSARLAWWGTAWLEGRVGPDDLLDAVLGEDAAHVVVGCDGGLLGVLALARGAGAAAVGAAFPGPGDPVGLGGPAALTSAALDAGEAALLLGTGVALVPNRVGRAIEWSRHEAARRPPPDLGEADRSLRAVLLRTADTLAGLDIARWRPEVADELHDLRAAAPLTAPPGVPPRCVDLAGRALRLRTVVDIALADEGAAVSAGEMAVRREAIEPLARAVRLALTAACSPDGWPPR